MPEQLKATADITYRYEVQMGEKCVYIAFCDVVASMLSKSFYVRAQECALLSLLTTKSKNTSGLPKNYLWSVSVLLAE